MSIHGILMSSMASLSAGIDPRHILFWGNYITAPLIFTKWYLYKSHGCSKYLPWPSHWLTFWFGGQSSTVLQDTKKHNSEGGHKDNIGYWVTFNREQSPLAETNTLTVCDKGVSGTPSGLSPAWGTHTDLLKHTCRGSDRERKRAEQHNPCNYTQWIND